MRVRRIVCVVVGVYLGLSASGPAFGALASALGGSGFSETLSSNKTVRRQQLICDPVGAPMQGKTSINYDPTVVQLTSAALGPGYFGQSLIEVNKGVGGIHLVD